MTFTGHLPAHPEPHCFICEVGRVRGNPPSLSPFQAAKGDTSRDSPDQAGNSELETGGFSVLVYSFAIDFN